jgi:hypothetical protein
MIGNLSIKLRQAEASRRTIEVGKQIETVGGEKYETRYFVSR